MKQQSVLRGSVWLIGSALIAKVLGAVFRIPLTAMLGGAGMGYFSCAYGIFLPVFALSVTGINTAVSAVTAQALAKHDPDAARRTAKLAARMFGIVGAGLSAALFLLAAPLCRNVLHNPQAALSVRMLAPAIWICCLNAVRRGVCEGYRNMTATAVSQVTEGIGRAIFGLLLCSAVLHNMPLLRQYLPAGTTDQEAAAAAAILGVTISAAIGLLTLCCFPSPHSDAVQKPVYTPHSDSALRRSLLRILLPVAAASLVTNLTSLIDLAAGLRLLTRQFSADAEAQANFLFGAYSGMSVTVFNLVPAVTNMLGKGVFPAFAASYAQHRTDETALHAERVIRRTAFLAIPAGMGITALAEPILLMLFPARQPEIAAAAPPLCVLGIAVMFAALSFPLFTMLQASGHAGDTVTVMLCGAAVKFAGNLLLIPRFQLGGIALSTTFCYAVILFLALRRFRQRTAIRLRMLRLCGSSLVNGLLCAVTARAAYYGFPGTVPQRAALLLAAAAGGAVYLIWQGLTHFAAPARTAERAS